MNKQRFLTLAVSAVCLIMLVTSARADSVHLPPGLHKLNLPEGETLSLLALDRTDLSAFLSEHFASNNGKHLGFANSIGKQVASASNNGKHLGFSVAAMKSGVTFGLTPQRPDINVVENPEPTGMILLGTGLAAIAGYARRRSRRRRGVR
ncbi:MAG TPA: PEP-CTERM sorting domain-containing protein [Pyrinomonadaceae bacterium]|nr:PEP-CTERM sorting domain-containing protein [Pyrinomonadaceae bacterium]